jgi:hypothetical protein
MRTAALLALLAATAAPVAAEVTVRVTGGTVDLTATAAPLADILDRLGRQTGMRVVYEGAAPRQLVTVTLKGRTPAETVLSVLEGLGVNFALVADTTGARVQTLVVAGAATASAVASSSGPSRATSPSARRPFGPPPGAAPEPVEPAFEEGGDEEDVPEEGSFPGLPPGAEVTDPSGVPMGPDPGIANPGGQAPTVPPPGAGMIPSQPAPSWPASPFAPQAQPFPPLPPGTPGAPNPGGPPPEEGTPTNPPPF